MLEVLCEPHAIVRKMGLLATCHDRVSACLVKIEQFLDKCYDGFVNALLDNLVRCVPIPTMPRPTTKTVFLGIPSRLVKGDASELIAIQQDRVMLKARL